jgi:intracellular septation protein
MKLLFTIFPILLFFIAFKLFGIYTATAVAMIASVVQVITHRISYKHYEKLHLISLVLILTLGSATLIFHNPSFIKWKPTGIYWLCAITFLSSTWMSKKNIVRTMFEANIQLPEVIWHRLNMAWVLFFTLMGAFNLYVAFHYDMNTWVNFKLFAGAGVTLLFVFLQALYLTRDMQPLKKGHDEIITG